MAKKLNQETYEINNPEYRYSLGNLGSNPGYLIVGDSNGKAVLGHFGEGFVPHERAIAWYKEQGIKVVRVFTNAQIHALVDLKDKFHQKPVARVVGELERLLL